MSISVIIPFDGVNNNLLKCIKSVYYPSDLEIETILIYDDNKLAGISELEIFLSEMRNVHLIFSEKKGISASLNRGINFSRSSYIARLDADDLVLPGRFEIQSSYLEKNADCAVVGGQVEYINENDKFLRKSNLPTHVNENLKNGCYVIHPTVMIRRSVFNSLGGYRELFKIRGKSIVEDYELWLRISKSHRIHNLEVPVLRYREHKNQSSHIFQPEIRSASLLLRLMNLYGAPEKEIMSIFQSQDLILTGEYFINYFETNYEHSLPKRILLKDVFLFFILTKNISFKDRAKILYSFFKLDVSYILNYFLKEICAKQSWIVILIRYLRN